MFTIHVYKNFILQEKQYALGSQTNLSLHHCKYVILETSF